MDDHLLRLAWAFPLVLAIGVGSLWVLKKWGRFPKGAPTPAPSVTSVTALSEQTRLIVFQHGGREFLLLESSASHVQCLAPEGLTPPLKRSSAWWTPTTSASST